MEIRINDKTGFVEMDHALLDYVNFSGRPTKYNPAGGVSSFRIYLQDPEIIKALEELMFNVRNYTNRNGVEVFYIDVKVDLSNRGLIAYLTNDDGEQIRMIGREMIDFDNVIIEYADLDIFGSEYTDRITGQKKKSAWLRGINVHQRPNRFKRPVQVAERV